MKIALLVLISFIQLGVAGQTLIEIVPRSGSSSTYSLEDIKRQTFGNGKLITRFNSGGEIENTLEDIRIVKFKSDIPLFTKHEHNELDEINLFPMPVSNMLYMNFESSVDKNVTIQIISFDGRVIKQSMESVKVGSNKLHCSVGNLVRGIYVVRINLENTQYNKKIIKK